jgi:hypothetical protein
MIYRYCKQTGFDILLNLRLRASKISEFNDPFELAFGIETETALENIRKDYQERPRLINAWKLTLREHKVNFDENSIEDIIGKVAEFQISDLRRVGKLVQDSWKEKMGVTCFSRKKDIIQMWAHYADDHRGIVIGIDESKIMTDPKELAEVEYGKDFVRMPVFANPEKIDLYESHIRNALHRKEKMWEYESEVRFYINLNEKSSDGQYYKHISAESIKEIYLGLRANETTEIIAKEISKRSNFKHLKVLQMSLHPDKFELVPNPV